MACRKASIANIQFVLLLIVAQALGNADAVFKGTPVFLRFARVEETAALFTDSVPNTEIFFDPIQKAAETALVARLDKSLQVANANGWTPPDLESRTYYSVAFDYYAKGQAATQDGTSFWIHNPGMTNFILVDKSPEHMSLNRVFRTAAILATASVFTRPRDPNTADRYQHVATTLLKPVFMTEDAMRPDMTWAAAIPKDSPDKVDSLQPNPNGFMELNALPLILDVISMLQVNDESIMYLKQWLQDYKLWLLQWRSANIHRFSPEGELSMKLQLATITHYLGDISEYHSHCFGTDEIYHSWIDIDGHLTTTIPANSPHESTLKTLSALTSLALVCAASPTNLMRLPAPSADNTTRPLLALAAKRAADQFAGHNLYLPTDTGAWPTRGTPYGLAFYEATETLPALYQAYGQKEVSYFMQSLVAANKDEHKSGRALLSALRHVSPTSPQNLVFLTGTANSGEFSCEARKALDLARCQPKDFINTKAGIAVVVVLCIAAAAGLCIAGRWYMNMRNEQQESGQESPETPASEAVTHVTITVREKLKNKLADDKDSEGNSGSGFEGRGSEARISSSPAGMSAMHHSTEWKKKGLRGTDSAMTSSRQSLKSMSKLHTGNSSSICGNSSFHPPANAFVPHGFQWGPGATMPMHGAHAAQSMYASPHWKSAKGKHAHHASPHQASTAPLQMGYGMGGMGPYYPHMGGPHTGHPSRHSRSRTPPRTHRGARSATSHSPSNGQRSSKTHSQLMESLEAFKKATEATKSSTLPYSSSKSSKKNRLGPDALKTTGISAHCEHQGTPGVNKECSLDDVPMQPKQAPGLTQEASDSTVMRYGSVSFALPHANSNCSAAVVRVSKLQTAPAAPQSDSGSSGTTSVPLTTYAAAVPSSGSAVVPEGDEDAHAAAKSNSLCSIQDSGQVTELSDAELKQQASNRAVAAVRSSVIKVSHLEAVPEQQQQGGASESFSGVISPRDTINVVDVTPSEDDTAVLSVSSVVLPQNGKKVVKSPDGSIRLSKKLPDTKMIMSPAQKHPAELDTLQELAPSIALLREQPSLPGSPERETPQQTKYYTTASPERSPAAMGELDDSLSCMHMPPPPTSRLSVDEQRSWVQRSMESRRASNGMVTSVATKVISASSAHTRTASSALSRENLDTSSILEVSQRARSFNMDDSL